MDIDLTVYCRTCRAKQYIPVMYDDLVKYYAGELIQNALPYLTRQQREMIITRTCSTCWTELFGVEEEDCGYCGSANDPDVICKVCWDNMP